MKLILGVVDIPYSASLTAHERRTARWRHAKRSWQGLSGTQTTGDVAEILEARYGVMQHFWEAHGEECASDLADVLMGKIENALMGAPEQDASIVEGDLGRIEERFRAMLDNRELDGRVEGVPTQAALRGVNHRLAHPYARGNSARPSFIDTGAYQNSMRAWIEE